MQCEDVGRELVNYYYEEVDDPLRIAISEHIPGCPRCQRAWEELKSTLNTIKKPFIPSKLLEGDYLEGVYKKIKEKRRHRLFLILASTLAPVILLVSLSFAMYLYTLKVETGLISQDYELIENLELFQDIDIIQNLDELEAMDKEKA
ncbi:MAG TPA: anti-sigma factor family protein [Candidatus Hypogeohydataceae bacterium YC38]|nr:hypothetical protein [Candidatus Brocadiales bacterium]